MPTRVLCHQCLFEYGQTQKNGPTGLGENYFFTSRIIKLGKDGLRTMSIPQGNRPISSRIFPPENTGKKRLMPFSGSFFLPMIFPSDNEKLLSTPL